MLKHPLFALLIRPLLFVVGVFLGIRALLFAFYPEYFADLSGLAIVEAYVWGLKFDFSIAALAYALPLVLILISQFTSRFKSLLVKAALWTAFALFSVLWWLYIGSVAYFGEVYRHLGYELVQLTSDMSFVVSLASSSHLWWLLAASILLVGLGVVWHRFVILPALTAQWTSSSIKVIGIALILVMELIAVRGFEFSGKSIAIADAFALGNEQQAAVAMNGAFSAIHNVRRAIKTKQKPIRYYQEQDVLAMQAESPLISFERVIPDYYPEGSPQRNLVVILLESWSYKYIDGLAGSNYGVTPFMDQLIQKSAIWTNAFAAGQRSIEGIQAILTSVPLIEGRDTIGFGLEQQTMTSIAKEANKKGYHTVFMQTSKRRSFHVDAIAGALGFQAYFGMEDFPELLEYGNEVSDFGWDYEGLSYFADYLKSPAVVDKPTFSFFFTGTTHEPFPNPGQQFNVYPHDANWENRYLNTLKYSDWALSQFMERMAEHPKYHETIFIFVADHVLKASVGSKYESFQIPLIIYTPDGSVPIEKHEEYASQYDVLPTIDALLGINSNVSVFGRSLLTEPAMTYKGALSKQGGVAVWLTPDGWATFNAANGEPMESTVSSTEVDSALGWNKLRLQKADKALRANRWFNKREQKLENAQ